MISVVRGRRLEIGSIVRKASAERIATDVLGDHTRTLLFGNGALEIWTGGLHVWKIGGRLIDVFGDLDHSLDKDLIVGNRVAR